MSHTSISLLDRLRTEPDEQSWKRLVDLYTPLIRSWLLPFAVPHQDSDDVVQEVLIVLLRKLPEFDRQRNGAFRAWLRKITVNCLRVSWRSRRRVPAAGHDDLMQMLGQLEDPHSDLSQLWDREHHRHLTACLLEAIRPRFEETTWKAFQRVTLDGLAPSEVARELGVSVNAVFIAKSRVLSLLRQEGEGLLD